MSAIAATLRGRVNEICASYERACVALEEVRVLERSALLDHLPEVIAELAVWVESPDRDREAAKQFALLAEGHALQRLGFQVSLETLTEEYVLLRQCILRELLHAPDEARLREDLISLNLGIDHAVMEAVRFYTQQRDLMRERFLGILGHDLRGPLNAIAVGVAALLTGELDPRATRIAARVSSATQRMNRMIGDMLDFARGHLGHGIPCNPTRQDLGRLCLQAVEEVTAAHPERTIACDIRGDLVGTYDADRITQALGNLLGNAIAHGTDPITLVARADADRGGVSVSVANAGAPVPGDLLPRIFDPFRGGRGSRSAGLGLGLYIVQQIARAHGGDCTVTSTDEETIFTLHLPRVPVEQTPDRP